MMTMKKIIAIVLVIIAVVMLYLGITSGIWAPALTGVGFILIAIVFFKEGA